HVYDDTPVYLRRWHDQGAKLYVYSSGSEDAQRLIFGHSDAGDLTPLFSGYFDTRIGGKREAQSYRTILERIGQPGEAVLFLSDV
ncbi:HAD family hydrolase, partial [Acinetobacter baumannii]